MEFNKCVSILESRQHDQISSSCPCRHQINESDICLEIGTATARYGEMSSDKSTLELVNNFVSLQEERVQVYRYFDNELKVLLSGPAGVEEYPKLCTRVTAKFSDIGIEMVKIRDLIGMRNQKELLSYINAVQQWEKKKLMLIAAKHLDILQDKVSTLSQMTGGKTERQEKYLAEQLEECFGGITEALEGIMSAKCELLEDDE